MTKNEYRNYLDKAIEIMKDIDKEDAEILALYFKEKTYLWSEDKDFLKAQRKTKINLLKTEDFL